MKNIKVSIIIPCYNSELWIEQCIKSALDQDVNKEIIVIDDGSIDKTPEILIKYSDQIKIIRQKNSGVSTARKNGLVASSGEYIKFLDSDDLLPKNSIKNCLKFLEHNKDLIIIGKSETVDNDGKTQQETEYYIGYNPNHDEIIKNEFILTQATHMGLWLIPRNIIDPDTFFNNAYKLGEEYLFCTELYKRKPKIKYLDIIVYLNRNHNSNNRLSKLSNHEDHIRQVDLINKCTKILNESKNIDRSSLKLLSNRCWILGRHCLRVKDLKSAETYFKASTDISINAQPVGSITYIIINFFLGPVKTEKLVEGAKKIGNTLTKFIKHPQI